MYEDLIGKACMYEGSKWSIVGMAVNIFGLFVTLEPYSGYRNAQTTVRYDHVEMLEGMD